MKVILTTIVIMNDVYRRHYYYFCSVFKHVDDSFRNHCIHGFPELPASDVDGRIGKSNTTVSVLIPEMNFTCHNVTLASFTVTGAIPRGQQNPAIQIWRENSSQSGLYYKIGRSIPIHKPGSSSQNVCANGTIRIASRTYLCILNPEFQVHVQSGDILGLEIPPTTDDNFEVYFINGGPMNYVFQGNLPPTVNLSSNRSLVQQFPQVSFDITTGIPTQCFVCLFLIVIFLC